jgi:fructose-1,6-bisphosphatase/inositol monophosphatase family enzyme
MTGKDTLSTILDPQFMAEKLLVVHRWIQKSIDSRDTTKASNPFDQYEQKSTKKKLSYLDLYAERTFQEDVGHLKGLRVVGEESLHPGIDLSAETQYCALLDIVDGTDLLERGMSNWCSAVVVFHPKRCRIEGAFVALENRTLYYAREDQDGAFKMQMTERRKVRRGPDKSAQLRVTGKVKLLRDAALCIYAQKSSSLLDIIEMYSNRPKFLAWLRKNVEQAKGSGGGVGFRFYNFAGNPMMVRLAENSVDVVAELRGQLPHDVVAGAFIAMKAGAVLGDANKKHLYSFEELAATLLHPADNRISYILASNNDLYQEAFELFRRQRLGSRST